MASPGRAEDRSLANCSATHRLTSHPVIRMSGELWVESFSSPLCGNRLRIFRQNVAAVIRFNPSASRKLSRIFFTTLGISVMSYLTGSFTVAGNGSTRGFSSKGISLLLTLPNDSPSCAKVIVMPCQDAACVYSETVASPCPQSKRQTSPPRSSRSKRVATEPEPEPCSVSMLRLHWKLTRVSSTKEQRLSPICDTWSKSSDWETMGVLGKCDFSSC
mmetsp:Transcript_79741/g.140666  ORF Transcript_79741/g.140666 Transcript_79741/m.140666 type:complete len:217 (-) Transcript_79741:1625-2275(-)